MKTWLFLNIPRAIFAWLMEALRMTALILGLVRVSGRHHSWAVALCFDCGWAGPRRWARHEYELLPPDDVSPVDRCPRCLEEV